MTRLPARLAFAGALTLLVLGGAGFARAAIETMGTAGVLAPSAVPDLLGPVNELGRNGWNCAPEHAAQAKTAQAAELPAEDRR